jgi:glutathione S-transferase/GST-like protein
MITLYYFPTPNGKKLSIALEEMGLAYKLEMVQIFNREQLRPEYLKICPNGRIPALVDHEPDGTRIRIFESGAILQYLGRKSGLFYPVSSESRRAWVDAWVFWQMAGLGPMTGQVTWFKRAAAKPGRDPAETSLAIHRFTKEMKRLYGVLEGQLTGREYVCDEYSIADMASWPWVDQHHSYVGDLSEYPNIHAWHARIAARPAVQRATKLGMDQVQVPSN